MTTTATEMTETETAIVVLLSRQPPVLSHRSDLMKQIPTVRNESWNRNIL